MRVDDVPEILTALAGLSRLRFPIKSAAALKTQLPGGRNQISLGEFRVDLQAAINAVPASYFPITSLENLISKAQSFFLENEHRIGIPSLIAPTLRRVAGALRYPVTGVEQIRAVVRSIGISSVSHGGRHYAVDRALDQFRPEFFPLRNARELYGIARGMSRGQSAKFGTRQTDVSQGRSMSQKPKVSHLINKATRALGDVVPTSGRVATAPPGYRPAPAERIHSSAARESATRLRSQIVRPSKKD
jgi:hypothetical protein